MRCGHSPFKSYAPRVTGQWTPGSIGEIYTVAYVTFMMMTVTVTVTVSEPTATHWNSRHD